MNDDYTSYALPFWIALGVFMLVWFVVIAGIYVLVAIALSRFFAKVGVRPALAWIPVYRYWLWLEVGGQPGVAALAAFVPGGSIVAVVFLAIGMHRTGIAFRREPAFLVLGILLPVVWLFILGSRDAVYEPRLITEAGYPPPLVGHGSARPAA